MKNKKYTEDFISGKKLSNYDELINDKEFMLNVIEKTLDKKYYYLCSKKLKIDADFIIKLAELFSKDDSFLFEMVDYYFDNVKDILKSEESFALAIFILYHVSYLGIEDKINKYIDVCYKLYNHYKELIKSKKSDSSKESISFKDISDLFNSNLIIDYCASVILSEIIVFNDINVEDLLHEYFDKIGDISIDMLFSSLINLLILYDFELSQYLMVHKDLMYGVLRDDISNAINKWDTYDKVKKDNYNFLFKTIESYFYVYGNNSKFKNPYLLLYYIALNNDFIHELVQYDSNHKNELSELSRNVDSFDRLIEEDPKEKELYNEVENIVINILFSNEEKISEEKRNKLMLNNKNDTLKNN